MIINLTKNKIISTQEINAPTFLKQARGLMFKKKANCLMIFNTPRPISLHNFCVFYPLDIILIDQNLKITEIKRNFSPFTLWRSKAKALYCLELATPSVYDVGDQLQIK